MARLKLVRGSSKYYFATCYSSPSFIFYVKLLPPDSINTIWLKNASVSVKMCRFNLKASISLAYIGGETVQLQPHKLTWGCTKTIQQSKAGDLTTCPPRLE